MVQNDQSASATKIVLAATLLVEKVGWLPPAARKADRYLVQALEGHRAKEETKSGPNPPWDENVSRTMCQKHLTAAKVDGTPPTWEELQQALGKP